MNALGEANRHKNLAKSQRQTNRDRLSFSSTRDLDWGFGTGVVHHARCNSLLRPVFWCGTTVSGVARGGLACSHCAAGGVSDGDRVQLQQTSRVAVAFPNSQTTGACD